ncbi:MAG: DUF2127 domain-containing protein [bacterium]
MEIKESKKEIRLIHDGFEIGILLKGIDGLLEIIGGLVLLFLPLGKIDQILLTVTRKELVEDPNDIIANYLFHLANTLSISALNFTIALLLLHGLVKVFLVIMLLKRKLWAYPVTMIAFGAFGVYQLYQFSYSHSSWLLILTLLDIIVIVLTWFEYYNLKRKLI